MAPSFEQRCEEVNDAIAQGSMGCPFAMQAARKSEIMYCPSPRAIDTTRPSMEYIEGLMAFSRNKAANVLIALPDADSPVRDKDCQAYAELLFPETVSSMQYATVRLLDEVFAEAPENDNGLQELCEMNPVLNRPHIFRNWDRFRHMLVNMPTDAFLLRRKTSRHEQMFPFIMDPSYRPLTNLPHPRWSPHFALIVNYRSDLQNLRGSAPATHSATHDWMRAVTGTIGYVQGYRIPQQTEIRGEAKAAWKPND